ncbi:MAG: helix-turn-helix domain-containing protein [Fulvivirga sp.]|uniref:helix-turn-helix domain-containing protein n=1 Tax=Fulvivirga sp. TaxID=1931237 RepID=UPI0032F03594
MSFQLNVVQIFVITSVVNGLVYAVLILFKRENQQANKFLALLLISLSLTFTPFLIGGEYFLNVLWLAFLPLSLAYWIGPAIYFYTQHLTNPSYKFKPRQLWHFAPIVLNYIHSVYHGLQLSGPLHFIHVIGEFLEFTSIISVFIYSYFALKKLNSYNESILNQLSNIEHVHLQWLKSFIKVLISLFIIVLLYYVIAQVTTHDTYAVEIEWFRSSILLIYGTTMYWLSISGYRQSQTLNNPIDLSTETSISKTPDLVQMVLERKLYTDPELSLRTLSKKTDISEKEISTIINRELNKNFYQFINEFRIEEVKSKLKNPQYNHLKIISIAYECGFNSKATFNRLFKNMVGQSPQEYKESN